MSADSGQNRTLSPVLIVVGVALALAVVVGLGYLNRPGPNSKAASGQASAAAKAYLRYLELSDVTMAATDNFMNQRVVEIQGKIANKGASSISSADVYCLFSGIDGVEIHRERAVIVAANSRSLRPGESRPFRLPFDALPDGWNQALPRLVVAEIQFKK